MSDKLKQNQTCKQLVDHQNIIKMSYISSSSKSQRMASNKKVQQSIQKFIYDFNFIQQNQYPKSYPNSKQDNSKKIVKNNIKYHYIQKYIQLTENVYENQQENIQEEIIKKCSSNLYLDSYGKKIKSNSILRSFAIANHINLQTIEFVIKTEAFNTQNNSLTQRRRYTPYSSSNCSIEENLRSNYYLYVIHLNNDHTTQQNCWENFVEEYCFTYDQPSRSSQKNQPIKSSQKDQPILRYRMIAAYQHSPNLFNYFTKHDQLQGFFEEYEKKSENLLLQMRNEIKKEIELKRQCEEIQSNRQYQEIKQSKSTINDESTSMEESSHRRQLKLPLAQRNLFKRLKEKIFAYFKQINPIRKMNKPFLENLVCRFMKHKEYNEENTFSECKQYLNWEKSMREKYTFDSFKLYHEWDIFSYIGKDNEGRPVLYNYPHHVYVDQIPDEQVYIDYVLYMLEIHTQDYMQGYVDQIVIVSDYSSITYSNFSFSIVQKITTISEKFFPDRQKKLINFGIGWFAFNIYKIVKPIIPKFAVQKIQIFDSERAPLRKYLEEIIDISILPSYIFEKQTDKNWQRRKSHKNVRFSKTSQTLNHPLK